jgi:hypothetical protein
MVWTRWRAATGTAESAESERKDRRFMRFQNDCRKTNDSAAGGREKVGEKTWGIGDLRLGEEGGWRA